MLEWHFTLPCGRRQYSIQLCLKKALISGSTAPHLSVHSVSAASIQYTSEEVQGARVLEARRRHNDAQLDVVSVSDDQ